LLSNVKATYLLLLLMPLLAGCKNALDVYESKAALAVTVAFGTNGITLSPSNLAPAAVLVTGAVQRVELPLVNTPSIAGDKAKCIILVPVDAIPAHPDCSKVALHYDSDGWLQGIKEGTQLVLRFKKDGRFDGVQFPPNLIQPSGAAK
jgi:hypothetical protein